jgi:hypothetical protein
MATETRSRTTRCRNSARGATRSRANSGSDRKWSAEERRELAERTRMLLLAVGLRLQSASKLTPSSPEQAVGMSGGDFVREFDRYRIGLTRDGERRARHEAITRAANFALGRAAARWLDDPNVLWSARRSYIAAQSDEGFEACLSELAALRE